MLYGKAWSICEHGIMCCRIVHKKITVRGAIDVDVLRCWLQLVGMT